MQWLLAKMTKAKGPAKWIPFVIACFLVLLVALTLMAIFGVRYRLGK